MELHGLNLIAGQPRPGSSGPAFRAACPNDGSFLETEFSPAGPDEAAQAKRLLWDRYLKGGRRK